MRHVSAPPHPSRTLRRLFLPTLLVLLLAGSGDPAAAQWWKRGGGKRGVSYGLRFVDAQTNQPTPAPVGLVRVGERHRVLVALYAIRQGELDTSAQLASAPGGSVIVRLESGNPRVLTIEPAESQILEHYGGAMAEFWLVGKSPGNAQVTARAMLGQNATASTWFGPVRVEAARVAEPKRLTPKPATPAPVSPPVEPEDPPAAPAETPAALDEPPATPAASTAPAETPVEPDEPPATPTEEDSAADEPDQALPTEEPPAAEPEASAAQPEGVLPPTPEDTAVLNPTAVAAPVARQMEWPAPLRERATAKAAREPKRTPLPRVTESAAVPVPPPLLAKPEEPTPAEPKAPVASLLSLPPFSFVVQPAPPESTDRTADFFEEDAPPAATTAPEISAPEPSAPEPSTETPDSPADGLFAVDDLPSDMDTFDAAKPGTPRAPETAGPPPPPCPRVMRLEITNVLEQPVQVRVRDAGAPAAYVHQMDPGAQLHVVPTHGEAVWIEAERADNERQGLRLVAADAPESGALTLPVFTEQPWLEIRLTMADCPAP